MPKRQLMKAPPFRTVEEVEGSPNFNGYYPVGDVMMKKEEIMQDYEKYKERINKLPFDQLYYNEKQIKIYMDGWNGKKSSAAFMIQAAATGLVTFVTAILF